MPAPKFIVSCAVLGAAVVAAVSTLGAQEPRRPEAPRRDAVVADGRGFAAAFGMGSQLGVRVADLDAAGAKGAAQAGVRIEEVTASSPAEKAGLKVGDIVVEYDGERVRSARQFTRLVQETPEGRQIRMAVLRNGQRQTVDATPEARAFTWNVDVDGDRIRREVERGMPRMFDFRFDDRTPGFARPRGRLGVSIESLTPQLADYFGAKGGGVLVSSVAEDSAAKKAGVKAGDVITSVNGTGVAEAEALVREISKASGEVTLGLLRDRKETTIKVTLEAPRAGGSPLR